MCAQKGLVVAAALVALLCERVEGNVEYVTIEQGDNMDPRVNGIGGAGGGFPIHLEFLSQVTGAWPDLPTSTLHSPPQFLSLLPTTLSHWALPAGSVVTYSCPSVGVADVCDAWMFFYSCPQSCVTTHQGGLPGLLGVTPDWERTQCAPSFATGVPGTSYTHPMSSFRHQLTAGQSVSFTLPGDGEFLAFGLDTDGVDCTQHLTAGACPVAGGRCRWEDGVCKNQTCRGRYGPPPPCRECPWQGLVSRPGSDGPFQQNE